MRHVDIWSKGNVIQYLQKLLESGQIEECRNLKGAKGLYNAFYARCTVDRITQIIADNVSTSPTAYNAPSSYHWPGCSGDCSRYAKPKDFLSALSGQEGIPTSIIGVVGEVLGNQYYSHNRLNSLFWESGAPGDPPKGNCVQKCQKWLKRCNSDPKVDAFVVLGKVLEDFMEMEGFGTDNEITAKNRVRVNKILVKHSLSYHQGGQILGAETGLPSRSLKEILASRDLVAVEIEFQRAIDNVESDPAAGITAASSMIESLCIVYIEDEDLEMPSKQIIKNLWKVVRKHIGLDPGLIEDQDISRILSGCISVVDGIGALRTHTGTVHGRGRKRYKLEPRHARLAIHAAHTLVIFVIETWESRK